MQLSALIAELQEKLADHGELPCYVYDADGGLMEVGGLLLGTAKGSDEVIDVTIVDAVTMEDIG